MANLYPLLHQSLNWFQSLSSALEMGLLSNDDPVEVETDITASMPLSFKPSSSRETRSFHALKEECTLDEDTLNRFRDRF